MIGLDTKIAIDVIGQRVAARRAGLRLVTANFREFARVPGLLVADWMA